MTRTPRPLTPGRYYDRIAALRADAMMEALEAARNVLHSLSERESRLLMRVPDADREEALRLVSTVPMPEGTLVLPPEEPIPFVPTNLSPEQLAELKALRDGLAPDPSAEPTLSQRLLADPPPAAPIIERDHATGKARRV